MLRSYRNSDVAHYLIVETLRCDVKSVKHCDKIIYLLVYLFLFLLCVVFFSGTMSSKATLALLIYGIITHFSASCSHVGLSFPSVR